MALNEPSEADVGNGACQFNLPERNLRHVTVVMLPLLVVPNACVLGVIVPDPHVTFTDIALEEVGMLLSSSYRLPRLTPMLL